MSDRTKIEWTDASWTPIRARNVATGNVGWHCSPASPGCENCYAENMNGRLGTRLPFKPGHRGDVEIFLDEKLLLQPLRWKRPRMIFACSMTDLFGAFVPDEMIDRIFAVMALCPQHTFQVLTKRSKRLLAYMSDSATRDRIIDAIRVIGRAHDSKPRSTNLRIMTLDDIVGWNAWALAANLESGSTAWPLPNIWLGVSCEDQRRYDERRRDLELTPAAVRFLSIEPMLGAIDIRQSLNVIPHISTQVNAATLKPCGPSKMNWIASYNLSTRAALPSLIHWVIVGGESGRLARPMHPDWARTIRDQCEGAAVAFFFKQWGEFAPHLIERDEYASPKPGRVGEHIVGSFGEFTGYPYRDSFEVMRRFGKKAAGRLLDGREWNEMPDRPENARAA